MNFIAKEYLDVSNVVDIGKFHETHDCSTLLPNIPFSLTEGARKIDILNIINCNIDEEYLDKLAKYCDDEEEEDLKLRSSKRALHVNKNFRKIPAEGSKFKTIQKLKKRIVEDSRYKFRNSVKSNYTIEPMDNFVVPDSEPDLIPGKEVLIKIKVYQHVHKSDKKDYIRSTKLSHELIVLGSHTLDVFIDQIKCPNGLGAVKDMSENPDSENMILAKDVFKSGFLYINDTFYNDTRHPENIDYSENIRKWAENKKHFPEFKTAIMQDTTFNDLKVPFGQPQVYMHHGNCEHVLIFSDIEILKPSDVCFSQKYPCSNTIFRKKGIFCTICGLFVAKWLVTDSDRLPFKKAYFCESCFYSYNYIDGKKVGNFKAYPYISHSLF